MSDLDKAIKKAKDENQLKDADLRQQVLDRRKLVEESYWELSVLLHQVYHGCSYQGWGYDKWKDYVEQELDFRLRKAQYLVGIQDWFGTMDPNIREWVKSIGWTRAKELINVVSEENAAEWMNKLKGKTLKEILEIVEADKTAHDGQTSISDGGGGDDSGNVKPTKIAFKVFSGQRENIEGAIEKAMLIGETKKPEVGLDLICTEYMNTSVGVENSADYLAHVEKMTGLRLIAFDGKLSEVLFGADLINHLGGEESS